MQLPTTKDCLPEIIDGGSDRAALWRCLDNAYRGMVLAWCRRRGVGSDAEDLTQEILMKVVKAARQGGYRPDRGPFVAWLKIVAKNSLRDYWRSRKHQLLPVTVGGSVQLDVVADLASSGQGAERQAPAADGPVRSHAAEAIDRARSRVGEKTWQAFVGMAYEKRPAADVAEELGLSIAAVSKHAYRVKRILKEEMKVV
jgi:RNA polymerase sigma-70 factor (ECF subfamily)